MKPKQRFDVIKNLLDKPFDGYNLTAKEHEATRKIAFGYTQEEVCSDLGISRQALQLRLKLACRKIGLKSSKELTRWCFELLLAAAD